MEKNKEFIPSIPFFVLSTWYQSLGLRFEEFLGRIPSFFDRISMQWPVGEFFLNMDLEGMWDFTLGTGRSANCRRVPPPSPVVEKCQSGILPCFPYASA